MATPTAPTPPASPDPDLPPGVEFEDPVAAPTSASEVVDTPDDVPDATTPPAPPAAPAPVAAAPAAPVAAAPAPAAPRSAPAVHAVGPLSGIFFVALFLISFMVMNTPERDASNREWTSYWEDSGNRGQGMTASIAMLLAGVAFLWLVAALRRRLSGAVGTDAFYAAGVAAGGLMLAAGLGAGLIPFGYELADTPIPDDADLLRTIDGLYFGTIFLPLPYALAGFLIPLFFALRGAHLVPEWLRIAALVVGVVALTGPFLFVVPHVLFLLWTLAASVTLLLRERDVAVMP